MEGERQTRSRLMSLFEQHGYHPRSDFGQNFLIDLNLLEFVVKSAQLTPEDVVLEIGTGTGGMTTFLAAQAGQVLSVELDHRVFQLAQEVTRDCTNVRLLNCDALKSKNEMNPQVLAVVEELLKSFPGSGLKLVANLPYAVATPIISNLVASDLPWRTMVVTIQWELALRMQARPRTSDYSALSVWLQSQCQVEILKRLPPTVFWPRPKVDSAIVEIRPDLTRSQQIADRLFFQEFLRRLFTQRRKHFRSVLAGMYRDQLSKPELESLLAAEQVPENARAEELEVATLVRVANRIDSAINRRSS
ncbi:MAG: 16S rRNA (adenine(1518)-N(6)/adenine(1519)-N(6))-dimethyltransferase RsmA [Planctomycetales bacterium]